MTITIEKYVRTPRTEGLSIMSRGLLAYIARHLDSTGTYREFDRYTAEADGNDSSKATIQRHRQELIEEGYLWHKPRVWRKGKSWSSVGVGITAKGWEALALNSKLGQVNSPTMSQGGLLTHGKQALDSRESDSIYSKDSCNSEIRVESTYLENNGIVGCESGSIVTLQDLPLLMARIAKHAVDDEDRLRECLDFVQSYDWTRADGDIAMPIQPKATVSLLDKIPHGAVLCLANNCGNPRVKNGYCEVHQEKALEELKAQQEEIQQATYEANRGLFDDKAVAAELKAIEQCNRLGLSFLEQGEEIGGCGPDSYDSQYGIEYLTGRTNVRRPLCECGKRVAFILDKTGRGGTKFWSLGTCQDHRTRCSCGRLVHAAVIKCDNDAGGYVQIAPKCWDCMQQKAGSQAGDRE